MSIKTGKGQTYVRSSKVYDRLGKEMITVARDEVSPSQWYDTRDIYKIAKDLTGTNIFSGGGRAPKAKKVDTDIVNGEIYKRLSNQPKSVNFFEAVANKTQGANEFIKKVIKFDQNDNIMTNKSNSMGNLMNFESLYKNVKKVQDVLDNSGTIAVFDLETLSGINKFGHSVLSNITEISGVQFAVNKHTAKVQRKMNTVLGFTNAEADDARRKLSGMMSRGKDSWTNEEKVFYDRMNIYGNSKAKQNGFNFEIHEAKGIEEIKKSRMFAEDGINFLEDVANKQTDWLKQNGITDTYDEYRTRQLIEFKNMLKESTIAQGHNVQGFDIRQLNIATGDNTPLDNVFDTLQPTNRAMAELGANSIYANGVTRKDMKRGRATQETLAEIHNLKDKSLAAHIAENDVMENSLFLFGDIKGGSSFKNGEIQISKNSYFNNVIMPNMEKMKKTYDKTSSLYKNDKQLFYMDYTMQKNFANQDGALSFEFDPMTKSFKTFDGYTVKDGNVTNAGFPAFGPRKGAVYQHGVYELEMNDEFKKQFMNVTGAGEDQANKIFQQYSNSNKLYMVESRQYMDIEELTKKLGSRELAEHYYNNRATTYTFETNFDRLGANLGINIGEVIPGGKKKKVFSHYSGEPYDMNRFKSIENTGINKPRHGLWASPLNGDTTAWKDWKEAEDYLDDLEYRMDFTLKDNAKVFEVNNETIKTLEDYSTTVTGIKVIDYEKLSKQYDALYVSQDFVDKNRRNRGVKDFGAWDVESLVIFNNDIIDLNTDSITSGDKVVLNSSAIKGLDFKRADSTDSGKAIVKSTKDISDEVLFDKIIDKSYDRTINDAAARKLRELDYKKVMQIRNYQNDIKAQGVISDTPIVTRIAEMVSKNKTIDLTTNNEIVNALGWHDYVKKQDKLVKETINSAMSLDGLVNKMGTFLDVTEEVLNDTFGILDVSTPAKFNKAMADPKNRETLWKKDMAFKQIFNEFLENVNANPKRANLWSETYHTASELNKIDFDMFKITPDAHAKKLHGYERNLSTNVASIDLNKSDSLLNTFYNAKFGDLDKRGLTNKQTNAGYDALQDAYKKIRADERFKVDGKIGIFNNIDINDRSIGVSALNDLMMDDLKSFATNMRGSNESWGYINPRMNMDVFSTNALTNLFETGTKEQFKKSVSKIAANLPKDYKLLSNEDSHKEAVNTLVNDYFMTFGLDDLKENMKGMTPNQQRYMERQYQTALETSKSKADSLLKSIQGTDINLFMTDTINGPKLSLIQGDRVEELSDVFRFKNRQGTMTYAIGDNEYALKTALGRHTDKGREKIFKLSNNVEKITSRNLDHKHSMWATGRGDSVLDAIVHNNKKTAQKLRDASARIDLENGQLHSLGFQFDANELITALPDLYNDGILEQIETKYGISDGAKQSIRDIIDKVAPINKKTNKRVLDKNYKDKAFSKVLPVELNFFTGEYISPLMETIFNSSDFDSLDKDILKEVGYDSKDSALAKGFLSGVNNYYIDPFAKMDNDSRPPVTQMQNTRLYNKAKAVESVTELRKKDKIYDKLNATSVYTSDNMEKYLYNNMSSTGEASTSGLTMKYMQIDSYSLRNQFLDEKNISKMDKFLEQHANKSDVERAKDVIRDKAKRLSTYEQQSSMDARIHDINFYDSNSQTISAKKKMLDNHKTNLDVINYISENDTKKLYFSIDANGRIKYDLGVKVKKNDVLGVFGNDQFSQEVSAKADGMFRGRFFDTHGNVVSEKQIQTFLNNEGLLEKGAIDNTDIMEALNKRFNFKYEVLALEEKHGAKGLLGASEKTTIDSMKLAVGEVNSNISQTLKDADADDIIGKVVNKRYLEEVTRKKLTDKYGTKEAQKIIDSIYNERYMFSDAVHQIDTFKDVQFFTNLDVLKHKSATALMHNGLNEMRMNGTLNEKNLDELLGKGTYSIVGSGENMQVKINQNLKEVDFNSILKGSNQDLIDAFTIDTRVDSLGNSAMIRDKAGKLIKNENFKEDKAIGHTAIAHINQVIDDSAGTSSGVFDGNVIGKGIKFSDAMGRNLDRQTYNLDAMQGVYSHYLDKGQLDKFKETFGHALDLESLDKGQLAFNDEYRNRSIAAPVTDRLRSKLIKSDYKETMEQIAAGEDREKYMHLIKSVKEDRLGNISVDRAELMYSYKRGLEAMEINAKATSGIVEKYMNAPDYKNFNVVDWSLDNPDWLDLQIGGQGKTVVDSALNPYTNNLILKTGFGGQDDYLAIARMPEKHTGDSLVQKSHISSLTGLQKKMQGYKEGTVSKETVVEHIRSYKQQMQEDITGKKGLIKDLTEYRMEQSFMGKGSGIIMSAFSDKDGSTLLGSGKIDTLNRMNPKIFAKAMFNGETLNQHYADGRVLDSLFMSESAFRDMGYFDKTFMQKTFGDNYSNLNKEFREQVAGKTNEEAMKHLLSTQGDAFVSVRYPEIMQGSDKFAMGYLDKDLKGNEMKVLGPTGVSAKLDFDGDTMNAARITTSNGLSRLNAVIQKEVDGELTAIKNSVDSSITTRAITDNAYWEKEVNNFMTGKKGYEMTSAAMDIKSIASHKLIDGKVYLDGIENRTELELRGLHKDYQETIKEFTDSKKESRFFIDGVRQDHLLVEELGEEGLNDFVAAMSWQNKRDMVTAKVYNNAIGETNVTNQKIKSIISGLINPDDKAYEYKSNLLVDFLYQAEEQAISSKSSVVGLSADRAQEWNRAISGLMKGDSNREANINTAKNWLNENLKGKLASGLYYTKSTEFQNRIYDEFKVNTLDGFNNLMKDNKMSSKVDDMLISDIMATITDATSRKNVGKVYDSLKIASSNSGGQHWLAQGMNFIDEQETNLKTIYNAFRDNFGDDMATNFKRADFINSNQLLGSIEGLISGADNIAKVSTEDKIGGIIDGIGDFAKSASGKKLAMGAVGIAAGIMVAGYVGGRPRPADVHAMEEARDYQTPMEGYQLADPGMMPGGNQQGYVININARTNKGRDNAAQALQQAISSGGNANINIAMNITDNYGNINDREIEKAILGAF